MVANKSNFWSDKLDECGYVRENEQCPFWKKCKSKKLCRRWNNPHLKYSCAVARSYGIEERIKYENK